MQLSQEKINLELKLSEQQERYLVSYVHNNFAEWDRNRISQREQYEKIKQALFADVTDVNKSNSELILLPQVYEQYHTIFSNIWKSNFANYDMMFNVQGNDEESQRQAALQKASLKASFNNMKLSSELHDALAYFLTTGEFTLFSGWETKTQQIRRKETVDEPITDPLSGFNLGTYPVEKAVVKPKVVYDGPKVTAVDPLSLVFDKSKMYNWDSCPKIYRSLATVTTIVENITYKEQLTSQMETELYAMAKASSDENNTIPGGTPDINGVEGDQIELLECWGDITLQDGTVLKNYVVVVAARKYLLRCEPNPYLNNPFSMHRFMPHPDTQRGRSMLLVAIPLNQVASQILNSQVRALKLIINPPYIAPMGMFTQNKLDLYPGKVIEYNDMFADKYPQPVQFKDALVGFDFLQLLETKIEGATGGFKYMVGSQDNRTRTATETSALVTGQNTRLSTTITFINSDCIIPMLGNVASLEANFNFDDKKVKVSSKQGTPEFSNIGADVKQADYTYVYGDSQTVVEMEAKVKKLADVIAPFADRVPIDWTEFLLMILQKLNIEDAERFIQADPLDEMMKGVPPEGRVKVKQQIAQFLQDPKSIQGLIGGGNDDPEAIQADKDSLAAFAIGKASLPDDIKMEELQRLGLGRSLLDMMLQQAQGGQSAQQQPGVAGPDVSTNSNASFPGAPPPSING